MDVGLLVAGGAVACDLLERARHVTLHTGDASVGVEQSELCRVVIEEDVAVPAALVMTFVAACPLPAVVNVVLPMTGIAAPIEVLGLKGAAVTACAAGLRMPPAEREARPPVVLECVTSPLRRCVARLAGAPKLSVVPIVALVTAVAVRRRALRGESVPVALLAGGAGVPARERELRFAQVVELRCAPLPHRRVARLAVACKTPAVLVVPFMARVAGARGGFEFLGLVAALTACLTMPALQPKRGGIMIESHRLPDGLLVAVGAGQPYRSFMRVLASVAIAAV
jgi:hypothetical protein